MASGFTPYKLANGKVVNIPNSELNRLMTVCKTKGEAVELWLCDHDYVENEEEKALTEKAKGVKIQHKAKAEYTPKTQRERVVKEDKVKEDIIKAIAEILPNLEAQNVVIEKKGKLITFEVGTDKFKLDLIRQRPPKADKG